MSGSLQNKFEQKCSTQLSKMLNFVQNFNFSQLETLKNKDFKFFKISALQWMK